jgi:outer membrane protein assembly factor BamE
MAIAIINALSYYVFFLQLNELRLFMQILHKCTVACLWVALAACASQPIAKQASTSSPTENLSATAEAPVGFEKFMGIFTPYRVTIQQGNFVSKEMADQVKEGMTREQVRFILGTPLLTDMFHADRWDYIFRLLKPSGELIKSRVTVYFNQSLVSKIERGDLPDEKEYLARIVDSN